MSNRNRIHKSSIHRRRGPTHTHDYPVEGGKKRRAEDGLVSPKNSRKMGWQEEGENLQTGRAEEPDVEESRYAPHNNYDDYDRIYPPSQGR